MANSDNPKGFVLVGRMGGGEPSKRLYSVDSSNSTAIFHNDAMKAEADGNVAPLAANDGNSFLGSALAIYDSNNKPIKYLAASTAGYVLVCNDPQAIYEVQTDSGTSITAGDVFATANHVAGAGDTTLGISRMELDASDIGTGLQFKIIDKSDTEDNVFGEHCNVLVVPNEQHFKATASI